MELFKNVLHVLLNGARAAFQNFPDLVVTFSCDDPLHDFQFPSGEIRRFGLGYARALWMAISASVPGGHDGFFLAKLSGAVHTHNGVPP